MSGKLRSNIVPSLSSLSFIKSEEPYFYTFIGYVSPFVR